MLTGVSRARRDKLVTKTYELKDSHSLMEGGRNGSSTAAHY